MNGQVVALMLATGVGAGYAITLVMTNNLTSS